MEFFRWLNAIRKELKALITGSLLLAFLGLYQSITGKQVPAWAYLAARGRKLRFHGR